MPEITIELEPKAIERLMLVIEDFNGATGRSLALEEWIVLYLEEKAIAAELMVLIEEHKKDVDADLPRWIAARRRELLEEIS